MTSIDTLMIRGLRIGKHNILLLTFVIFSWLCLVQYGACAKVKCQSDADCSRQGLHDHCCVKVTEMTGACHPNLKRQQICPWPPNSVKFLELKTGSIVRNKCSCGIGLTCTKVERKNWSKKMKTWSKQKMRKKTRYKYKCKEIHDEPDEFFERRGR
ncbi:uncharacterized protein [Clytia hemisphaerica]|uniref:Prokineticin domain-containing protein n=1 Tax=Clytia hemisphaerica TaxID=252671 RepID=A0A7M5V0U1_9CNID|eukprot:TCONS_00067597-protein